MIRGKKDGEQFSTWFIGFDHGTLNELPLPSTESPLRDKPIARASSLETLPSAKDLRSKSTSLIDRRRSREHGDYKSRRSKDTRDIYKEAFESAKRAEEMKFKAKFDYLLDDLHVSLDKSAKSTSKYGSASYGELMTTFKSRVKDQLKNLSSRLQLAYESFDTPQKDEVVTQKVRQNLSYLVEDILGESLDLTSDEAVSDLSSLSDESGAEHNTFEDQIAQAVLSKILDNHRKEVGNKSLDVTDGNHDGEDSFNDSLEEGEGEIDDAASDLTKDFEDLKKFVKESTKRKTPSVRSIDERVEVEDVIVQSVDYEREEKKENFEIRYSSLERVNRAEPPLPDFSDLENIDFNSYEVDPDLLSMNLAIIPEETEEDLDKVSKNEEDGSQWRNNWIIKGSSSSILSPYDNCGKRKIGGDGELFMMVPQPEDELVPQVGNEDVDQMSDFSDHDEHDEHDRLNDVYYSDEENSFYAKTSEELARISKKLSNSSFLSDSDHESRSRTNSVDFDNFKRTLYRSDSDNTDTSGPIVDKSKTKLKFSEELVPAENEDPKFVLAPESITIQEGDPLKLTCRVAGTGDIDVFWYREGDEIEELEDSEDYELSSEGDKHTITMYNLRKNQAGQYMCIALSEVGKCTQYFIITVKANKQELKKPEFLKGLQDVEVNEGQSVKFRCKVKGYPQPRVTWHKDGKHMKSPRNARIEKFGNRDYILTIDYATMDDDAEYSVVAKNIAGEAKSTAQVIVEPAKTDEEMNSQATTPSTPVAQTPNYSHTKSISHDYNTPINTRHQNGVSDLSDKFIATKYNMSYVAEEMLETANEFTTLHNHLDGLNKHLDSLESNLTSSDYSNNNNEHNTKIGDTSILEAVEDQQAMEKSAKSVRMLTSNALNILRTAEEIIQNEQDSDFSYLPANTSERLELSDLEPSTESCDFDNNNRNNETIPFDTSEDYDSVISDTCVSTFDDTPHQSTYQTQVNENEAHQNNDCEKVSRPSDLSLEYDMPDYNSSFNMDMSNVQTPNYSQSAEPGIRVNLGSKEFDKSRYQRDFCVDNKSTERKHWEVNLKPFSPVAEIVNRPNNTDQTEEQIYLAAGKVYSLGDRVRDLEARVQNSDDEIFLSPNLQGLEDEIAQTIAQVSQREREVNIIESAVNQLQLNIPDRSPRLSSGTDNSSQLSSPRLSVDSGFSSVREKPLPVHIVGTTAEDEVPESRGEYDADSGMELPSVNRLRAMFNNTKHPDSDLGDGNFTRSRAENSQVHSITARTRTQSKTAKQSGEIANQQQGTKSPVVRVNLQSPKTDINSNSKPNQIQTVNLKKPVPQTQSATPQRFVANLPNPPTYTDLEPGHEPVLIYPEESHKQSPVTIVKKSQIGFDSPSLSGKPQKSSASVEFQSGSTGSNQKTNQKLDVKRAVPKIRSGCISARAAFWEKRIETGSPSNSNVENDYPEMVEPPEN